MSRDFKELLAEFNARGVEFLLVGSHALAVHGHVRATKDLDLWVRPEPVNAERVLRALAAFGAPLHDLTLEDLSVPGIIFQIGVEPVRVDILTVIAGVDFADAWVERIPASFAGEAVGALSRRHLIAAKRAAGRPQDLADLAALGEKP
ncbi:MAG: nucleotidyltransferase [Thermoanaerobaculia bacterium]|nr:nucleotidyltransferase [Thermoanaerobaculia bacterium]